LHTFPRLWMKMFAKSAAVSKSFNDQISARLRQRQGEMLAKMAELASRARINVDGAGPSTTW
jgi:hypothetical protein